jgi:hypothetical protein
MVSVHISPRNMNRVQEWRGGLGAAYLFAGPFVCR